MQPKKLLEKELAELVIISVIYEICMYVYIYIYIHTYIYIYIHTYIHNIYIYIMYLCMYVYIYIYIASYLRVCLSTESAKNVSWPWLSPLRGWGSVTMAFTCKFIYIYIYYYFIIIIIIHIIKCIYMWYSFWAKVIRFHIESWP